jgi:hypothetical protein
MIETSSAAIRKQPLPEKKSKVRIREGNRIENKAFPQRSF